jgi:hypothetical protein
MFFRVKQEGVLLFSAPVGKRRSGICRKCRVVKTKPLEKAAQIRRMAVCTGGAAIARKLASATPMVEAYRTGRGPRQRVVAYLGEMDEAGRVGVRRQAGQRDSGRQPALFEDKAEPEWSR